MLRNLLALAFLSLPCVVSGQNTDTLKMDSSQLYNGKYYYPKPKIYSFLLNIPRTFARASKETFQKKSLPALGVMVGTTAVLILADQKIADGMHQFSNFIGLHTDRDYVDVITIHTGGSPIHVYQAPRNFNTVLYSAGEGLPPILISAALLIRGSRRSVSVASQIMQSNITIGIATQIVKRVSGRESPDVATQAGGTWRPLPSFKTYQHHTPHFDAFSSGHMATMASTATVLIMNYPEKKWLKPVCYTIISLVGLAMINNDVHWASDYPLAIGMGYISAKATVNMNRIVNGTPWKRK
jgi:membrane-associated phospholipid phosphatase